MEKRLDWIDVAKGLAILLVVLGHVFEYRLADPLNWLPKWIYSFHLIVFFVLAGYTFNQDKFTASLLLRRKISSLLVPYFFFGLVAYVVFVCGYFVNLFLGVNMAEFSEIGLAKPVFALFYGKVIAGFFPFVMQPLWFLVCIFFMYLVYFGLSRLVSNEIVLLVATGGISFLFYNLREFSLPFSLDSLFVVLPFFAGGILLKKIDIGKTLSGRKALCLLSLMGATVISVVSSQANDFVVIATNQYGFFPLFFVSGLAGLVLILSASLLLVRVRFLIWFGRNSLAILVTHMILIFLGKGAVVILGGIRYDAMWMNPALLSVIFVAVLLFSIPIVYFINRYLPFSVGKVPETIR